MEYEEIPEDVRLFLISHWKSGSSFHGIIPERLVLIESGMLVTDSVRDYLKQHNCTTDSRYLSARRCIGKRNWCSCPSCSIIRRYGKTTQRFSIESLVQHEDSMLDYGTSDDYESIEDIMERLSRESKK
jgi:hypothetical protein